MIAVERSWRIRVLPLVVACPLFLQNLDTTVMATALPAMATSLSVPVLDLKLAITSYLLSLAVFLPASAWLAGRFGQRRVFCSAVLMFCLGSAMCAFASTLVQLVACRVVQGMGGAMMVPLGRAILLSTFPPVQLVRAMIWFTVPGALGRLSGPLFGGMVVTWASWKWIFLLNIPFGLTGMALAWWLVDKDADADERTVEPLDIVGLCLLAVSLGGVLGALELAGHTQVLPWVIACMAGCGATAFFAYLLWSRHHKSPVLDFGVLRYPAYRIAILGGFPLRMAIGAAPFLLALLLQIGFGISALDAGILLMAMACGSLTSRFSLPLALRRVSFRKLMLSSALLASGFYAAYGMLSPSTPRLVMCAAFFLGGACTSMTMVVVNTVGYTEIPSTRTAHATALSAMAQQLSVVMGVVTGAAILSFSSQTHSAKAVELIANDFPPAFFALALFALCSAIAFRRLHPAAGEEMRSLRR